NKNFITNSQTSTKFRYGSTQDTYIIPMIAMAIDAYIPEPEGLDQVVTINGMPIVSNPVIEPGQEMEISVDIRNKGDEGINNTVVKVPIPFGSNFVSASGQFFEGLSGPQPYFDPNVGASGSIIWNLGTLPVLSGTPLLAKLTYKLKATTDCLILSTASCAISIPITGVISGIGATSQIPVIDFPFIQGYETNGSCEGEPISDPIMVEMDSDEYVQNNCGGVDTDQIFTFCNIPGSTIPFTDISGFFPSGSRFYNEFPVTPSSIEYTIASGFPATVGVTTYYAVPPNSTTCNFQFKIEITEINTVPTAQDIDYCVGETPVPLEATPSSQGLNLYFYTVPTGGTAQSSITPVTSTAGIFTFYVAEGVSPQCIGDRIPIVVTVHELPTAPVSSGDIIECTADPIQTLNANDAITPVSGESIVWYEANTGGTPVGAPTWNSIGSKTYFAETVNDATGCISSTRTPVELTIIDSPIVDAPADVTSCDSYTLPVLTNGNYFT